MTALEIHRQKEEELRKNDAYWQGRLVKQETDLKKTATTLEEEYNQTVRPLLHSLSTSSNYKNLFIYINYNNIHENPWYF